MRRVKYCRNFDLDHAASEVGSLEAPMLLFSPTLWPVPAPTAGRLRERPRLLCRSVLPRVRFSFDSHDGGSPGSNPVLVLQSAPPPCPAKIGLRRDPVLGLLSVLFVVSMAVGSFVSLAIISLPALNAFKKLELSADKLSEVVSEEVPGTLLSLKLSCLEISDLTSQLNIHKQMISGNQHRKERKR